jgi:aerobic-type carbon monoxide dehydrogenase small subunit (CoxS/CutS family)
MSKKHDVSRRQFLKGSAITAAGTAVLNTGLLAQTSAPSSSTLGPGPVTVTLRINGRPHQVSVEPRTTLAEVLRDQLHLTGTKVVCDRGACSACFALDVGKREVTTIEGLGTPDKMHPVQTAFVEHDALQCGYCTPGMVMSTAALLQHNPNATIDDIRYATRGNLCRCGTYPKVFEAALAAAGKKGA